MIVQSRDAAYAAFTKSVLQIAAATPLLVLHPTGQPFITLNPLITDRTLIPLILNPEPSTEQPDPDLERQAQIANLEYISHIALLATIVKVERTTHPSTFPTHRSIYATYCKISQQLQTRPKPRAKIYHTIAMLKKGKYIHVHRAHHQQGRPNQLSHQLNPHAISALHTKVYAIKHPRRINPSDLAQLNSTLNRLSTSAPNQYAVLTTIASLAAKTKRDLFNATDAYDMYTANTTNPMPKPMFLTAIRTLIRHNILERIGKSAANTPIIARPHTLEPEPKPPP
jgi:hypothetical protein